jgi:hypothetical protein
VKTLRVPSKRARTANSCRTFADAGSGLAVLYAVMGVAVLAVSLITNYRSSPKRGDASLGSARPVAA